MLAVIVLGVLLLPVTAYAGLRLVWAGRQLERTAVAPQGSVAAKVDERLQRTRAAVETLVMVDVEVDELQPSAGAYNDRAHTYNVLGLGLLGVAAALVLGVLLVL